MTNEEIRCRLAQLYECSTDFTVTQTGKQSSRVNGLYKTNTHEILLHNKNFRSDNQLLYTAIHEFTHHVLFTEKNIKSTKSHSGIFWSTFYDFLDVAIEKGFYSRERSSTTKELVEEAKKIQEEIIAAQKKLGEILSKLYESCKENGDRYEDVIESDLQISRGKAKQLAVMAKSSTSFSDEVSKVITTAKDTMSTLKAAESGKTIGQIKAVAKQKTKATDDDLDNPQTLIKEKKRLETTIERLNDRLVHVEETLRSIQGMS